MDCPPRQKKVAVVERWPLVEVRLDFCLRGFAYKYSILFCILSGFFKVFWVSIFAAGHRPVADHNLERFEIFGSMDRWFDGGLNQSGLFKQALSCRACFSLRSNPACKICAEIAGNRSRSDVCCLFDWPKR